MKKLILISGCLMLAGCSDAPTAERALRNAGFKDIQTTGFSFFGCGKDDFYSTGFVAVNANGLRVTGTVCSATFKGATIRFD